MKTTPWWKRWRGRLKYELQALRDAGATYEHDRHAFKAGFVRLDLRWPIDGKFMTLEVTFPDLYPYFRFDVKAPKEDLPYHQHVHGKNLCLIGRATSQWEIDDTVAGLLRRQLPRVLQTAHSATREEAEGVEQQQAEPFSDYYPHNPPAIVLVDGAWSIPEDLVTGFLTIGLLESHSSLPKPLIRGVVLEVQDNTKRSICKADPVLRDVYGKTRLEARWVQVTEPLKQFDPAKFFQQVQALDPGQNQNRWHAMHGGRFQLYGVHFPEEVKWRETDRRGWVFVARLEQEPMRVKNSFLSGSPKKKGR